MNVTTIDLYAYFGLKREEGCRGYLRCYLHLDGTEFRSAMLVIPGGGYSHVSDRESEPVASKYYQRGLQCFTLDYSVAPICYPTQLVEGEMAMTYIRENAEAFHLDKDKVVAIGFSAGAHLCAMLATILENERLTSPLGDRVQYCRPNGVILGYPVITAFENAHTASFLRLSGGDSSLYDTLSIERRVNKDATPAFIWGTVDDPVVPSENGFLVAWAYRKAGALFEYHVFESCNGVHGLSICEKETGCENKQVKAWVELSVHWMEGRGLLAK